MTESDQRGRTGIRRSPLEQAGDFAVWAGLYAVGVLGLLAWLTGTLPDPLAWVFVFLCAQGGYLFDRVKLSRSRMDPSDATSQPQRFRLLRRFDRLARAVVVVELVVAGLIGAWLWLPLAAVPALTAVGIWVYAGRPANPTRPRPKDWPLTKGLFIAGAHAMLAAGPLLTPGSDQSAGRLALSFLVITGVVFADAALCDLDDRDADASFGTMTIPVRSGITRAWVVALGCYGMAAAISLTLVDIWHAEIFAGLLLISTLIAMVLPRVRDFIDARLALVALVCLLIA